MSIFLRRGINFFGGGGGGRVFYFMARNANANVDILYKCTIDEKRVISNLQAGHEYS